MLLAVVSMATAQKGLMSGTSALLMAEIQSGLLNEKQVAEQYGLVYVNGEANITAFVELSGEEKALEDFGVKVQSRVGGMQTVCIPMKNYVAFAQSGLCSWLDVGIKPQQKLENARAELGIDGIYNGVDLPHGYDGTGVVVGIIDGGFQYRHPAFYDSTGTTLRIKRAWIQGDTIGTAPAGYSYGRELVTESDLLAAQTDNPNGFHGTHVAGIAAGCGGPDSIGRRYRGMAPNADIVMVSMATLPGIYDGIAYIRAYAASVGKPCVINMSLGTHKGPHDGTSSLDRMMDGLHAQYPEGFLVVGSAGNEGSNKLHLYKAFTTADTMTSTFVNYNIGRVEATIDLWSTANSPFAVSVAVIDTASGDTLGRSPWYNSSAMGVYVDSVYLDKTYCQFACNGTNPINNRQNITLTLTSQPSLSDTYRVALFLKSTTQANVHVWSDQVTFASDGLPGMLEGNTDCTVGEIGGTANSIITVGAYTTATSWTTLDGRTATLGIEEQGNLTYFSSHGPTLDLRTKPDVCAPGQHIVSSINRYCDSYVHSLYCSDYTLFNGDTAFYGAAQGTSMSSPAVAGIMALWLQQNPQLRYDSALALIRSTGRTDSLTGLLPASGSNLWGWGKINPLAGLTSDPTDVDSNALTNLVIFLRFADDEEIDHSFADIDSMFNGRTPGCYSVYNYFDAMTYGNIHYNTVYTNNVRNNVIVSYRDIYPRGHFRPYSEDNPEGYTGELPLVGISMLEIELLERIFNYVDTAGWVNPNVVLDGNGDGDIDNVSIIVKGMCDDWGDLLWPHMEFFPHDSVGHTVTINGVRVHAYNFEFEADSIYFTPKTFCHEMCHSLGLPDLYHYSHYTNIYTAGCWDVMDANWWGANHTAAIIKSKYLHVCDDPIEIICDGDYTLRSVGSSPSQNCYYIRSAVDPTQWFTFEYRRYQDPYEEGIPGTGLIAARWNDTVPLDIYTNGLFDFYTQAHQYWVFRPGSAIDTVNGEWIDANFSAATGRTSFGPTTDPHPYLTDGTPETSFEITNIQENGTELTFHVHFLGTDGIEDLEVMGYRLWVMDGRIVVDGTSDEVHIFDIVGREVHNSGLRNGVYLVKVGDRPARKVVVVK
jgi:M6 family metalloprotease-like protein